MAGPGVTWRRGWMPFYLTVRWCAQGVRTAHQRARNQPWRSLIAGEPRWICDNARCAFDAPLCMAELSLCIAERSLCQADSSFSKADRSRCQMELPPCQAELLVCVADHPPALAELPLGQAGDPFSSLNDPFSSRELPPLSRDVQPSIRKASPRSGNGPPTKGLLRRVKGSLGGRIRDSGRARRAGRTHSRCTSLAVGGPGASRRMRPATTPAAKGATPGPSRERSTLRGGATSARAQASAAGAASCLELLSARVQPSAVAWEGKKLPVVEPRRAQKSPSLRTPSKTSWARRLCRGDSAWPLGESGRNPTTWGGMQRFYRCECNAVRRDTRPGPVSGRRRSRERLHRGEDSCAPSR